MAGDEHDGRAADQLAGGFEVTTRAVKRDLADPARAATHKVLDVLDPASVLKQSLVDQMIVTLTYTDAAGRNIWREVEPMISAITRGRWLLVGWCRLRDAVRWCDLSRINATSATRRPCSGQAPAPPPGHRTEVETRSSKVDEALRRGIPRLPA